MAANRGSVRITYAHKKRAPDAKGETVEETEESGNDNASPTLDEKRMMPQERRKHAVPLDLPGPEPRAKCVGSKEKLGGRKGGSPRAPKAPGKHIKPPSTVDTKLPPLNRQGATSNPLPRNSDVSDREDSSRTSRMTEVERRAYLESQSDVAELDPHRIFCRCCNKWLKLSATQKYALAPWTRHKKVCTPEKPCSKESRQDLALENAPPLSAAEDDDGSSIAPSVSASERTGASTIGRRLSSAERQRLLEEDELSGEVRPEAVFCSACAKWVKLSTRTAYQLKNWMGHCERVHERKTDSKLEYGGATPSRRVREAERKLQLVNDAQAREFSASRVTCKVCSAEVKLSESVPYELDNWIFHKEICSTTTPRDPSTSATSPSSPLTSSKSLPPPSSASTDATLVATSSAAGTVVPVAPSGGGKKRQRHEDESDDDRNAVRMRTESYAAVDATSEGVWGWLKVPWETLKRGFAEGLGAGRRDGL